MQFKGSVRAPGDRDPGVRVVLDIDEYHLEIRRDSELFGRYYLADVEVARDIAERFILFLGDDEVEFLADDALQFAYGGVTAMQDAWLEAQKKKRRHRRAADAAARRKDDEPRPDFESPIDQPLHVSESDTVRRRRLQAGAPTRPIPSPGRPAPAARAATRPVPIADSDAAPRQKRWEVAEAQGVAEEAKEPAVRRKAPPTPPLPEPVTVEDVIADELFVEEAILDDMVLEEAVSEPVEIEEVEDTSLAARRRKITARAKPETETQAAPETKRAARAKAKTEIRTPDVKPPDIRPDAIPETPARPKAKPKDSDLGRVRVPEPVSARGGAPADETRLEIDAVATEAIEAEVVLEGAGQVRFAQEGHHPFETSTGLLAKLRGQPKRPSNHVHRFKESGSSVGLVRRVCTECAYVSIGSDD